MRNTRKKNRVEKCTCGGEPTHWRVVINGDYTLFDSWERAVRFAIENATAWQEVPC